MTTTPPGRADLVVVGGGICGTVCAAEATRRGARVVLLEKEAELAWEASGRSFGSLRVQGRHPAETPLAVEAIKLWLDAARTIGTDFELVQGGNLYIAEHDAEVDLLRQQLAQAQAAGLDDVRLLDAREVCDVVPCLVGPVAAGLYSPRDAHCDPRKATCAFAADAERRGAQILLQTRAVDLLVDGGKIAGVRTDRGDVRARAVVVAAGVWTAELVRGLNVRLPIKRIIYSQAESSPLPPLFHATIRSFRFSCRQCVNGRLVISAGMNTRVAHEVELGDVRNLGLWLPRYWGNRRYIRMRLNAASVWRELRALASAPGRAVPVGTDPAPDARMVRRAFAEISGSMPAVRRATLARHWAGFIDISPDGLPIIERLARPDGLVLLTGLNGHGLAIAPVLGRLLTDLALDGRTSYDIAPFRLARFEGAVPMPHRLV